MLTDEQINERDPVALQQELLAIDRKMAAITPEVDAKNQAYQETKAEFEVVRLRLKLLKERRSALQSVLKSLV